MAGQIYTGISTPSLGANLGSALGQGLLGGIQSVLDLRMKKLQQQEAQKAFRGLGFSEEESESLSRLDPKLQQLYLSNKKSSVPSIDQSGLAALQRLGVDPALAQFGSNVLGSAIKEKLKPNTAAGIKAVIPGISDEESQVIANLPPSLQAAYFRYISQSPLGSQTPTAEGGLGLLQNLAQPEAMQQAIPGTQPDVLQALQGAQAPAGIEALQQMVPQQLTQIAQEEQAISTAPINARDLAAQKAPVKEVAVPTVAGRKKTLAERTQEARSQKAAAEETRKQDAETRKIQAEIDKRTDPFVKEVSTAAKSAGESEKRLNRMEQLIKSEQLNSPGVVGLLEAIRKVPLIGVDVTGAYYSTSSQEFEKLSNDFAKDAKAIFGARLTDADLRAFMKTVPTLVQSDEGKLEVIRNMRAFNQASLVKDRIIQEIIKENGGKRPANIEQLVNERAKPELDAISSRMAIGSSGIPLPVTGPRGEKLPHPDSRPLGALITIRGNQYINTDAGWQPVTSGRKSKYEY